MILQNNTNNLPTDTASQPPSPTPQNTNFMFNNFFFSKIAPFGDNVENFDIAVQGTDVKGACALDGGKLWLQTHTENM